MNVATDARADNAPSLLTTVVLAAMAGGLGWGIRGQYGHETGAMIAGLLVCLTLVLLHCPGGVSLRLARAVAWGTIGVGFGGSMTYGQTVGLTHDAALVGNWEALRWGLLGLSLKGGLWIGFCGLFLGMGLGGQRYRLGELACMLAAMIGLQLVGIRLFNEPFDPAARVLPNIYFSADWYFFPDAVELKPRPEVWGGLLLALAGATAYVGIGRGDRLALRLALFAMLGGAIGFPLGQCIQAFHAWNPQLFQDGFGKSIDPINWWNCMETTFGAVWGGVLGLGVWLNRARIAPLSEPAESTIPVGLEVLLLAAQVFVLIAEEFVPIGWVERVADYALPLGVIPILAVAGGRHWPYFMVLPVALLPIAGKTLRRLAYEDQQIDLVWGWLVYAILPLALATAFALWQAQPARANRTGRRFAGGTLVLVTWLYYGLNHAFFEFPLLWPTHQRLPNDLVFLACALGLTWGVWRFRNTAETTT